MPYTPACPDELQARPFTYPEAEKAGLSRTQLRGRQWWRPFRGVYVHRSVPDSPQLRLACALLAVPEGTVAVGRTAAWLHGALSPRPDRPVPLELAVRHGSGRQPRRPGLPVRRIRLDDEDVEQRERVTVTTCLRTCIDLARSPDLVEGVVAVDAFLSADLVGRPQLWTYCTERRRWPGIGVAADAVLLGSDRSMSPGESRLRAVLVLAGLPEPMVNVTLYDEHDVRLGTPDLLYLQPLLGIEYDGAYHAGTDVRQVDIRRENGMLTAGVGLLRYSAYDLRHRRSVVVDEVAAALRRGWR